MERVAKSPRKSPVRSRKSPSRSPVKSRKSAKSPAKSRKSAKSPTQSRKSPAVKKEFFFKSVPVEVVYEISHLLTKSDLKNICSQSDALKEVCKSKDFWDHREKMIKKYKK